MGAGPPHRTQLRPHTQPWLSTKGENLLKTCCTCHGSRAALVGAWPLFTCRQCMCCGGGVLPAAAHAHQRSRFPSGGLYALFFFSVGGSQHFCSCAIATLPTVVLWLRGV
jgi:hypothetical protein